MSQRENNNVAGILPYRQELLKSPLRFRREHRSQTPVKEFFLHFIHIDNHDCSGKEIFSVCNEDH